MFILVIILSIGVLLTIYDMVRDTKAYRARKHSEAETTVAAKLELARARLEAARAEASLYQNKLVTEVKASHEAVLDKVNELHQDLDKELLSIEETHSSIG